MIERDEADINAERVREEVRERAKTRGGRLAR
jgi:hypothetical protein